MNYAEPFVVNEAYLNESGLPPGLIDELWTKMAPDVFILEKRLDHPVYSVLAARGYTLKFSGGDFVPAKEIWEPVWENGKVPDTDIPTYSTTPPPSEYLGQQDLPAGYWLRVGLVPPGERVRYPQLPAKVNLKEGLDMLTLRELYDWDGTGHKLRNENWGRD